MKNRGLNGWRENKSSVIRNAVFGTLLLRQKPTTAGS